MSDSPMIAVRSSWVVDELGRVLLPARPPRPRIGRERQRAVIRERVRTHGTTRRKPGDDYTMAEAKDELRRRMGRT